MVVFPLIFVTIHQWRHMVLEFALEGFACFAGQEFRQDAGIKAPFCSCDTWEKNTFIIYSQNFRSMFIIENNLVNLDWSHLVLKYFCVYEASFLTLYRVQITFWIFDFMLCFTFLMLFSIISSNIASVPIFNHFLLAYELSKYYKY